jgi:hypothetical protein
MTSWPRPWRYRGKELEMSGGFLWFVIGVGATLALFGFNQWLSENMIRLNWWQWLLFVAWALFLGVTVASVTTNLGEHETKAAIWSLILFGGISVVWGGLNWYFILGRKLATTRKSSATISQGEGLEPAT